MKAFKDFFWSKNPSELEEDVLKVYGQRLKQKNADVQS